VTPTSTATVEAARDAPRTEASRAEARRLAKASAPKRKSGRGIVSNEHTEGLRRFIRETMAEIRKVVWPDRETTRNLTIVVIAMSIVLGILLGGLDFILFQVFEAF
jgi:preprotein translocase subunit SecE